MEAVHSFFDNEWLCPYCLAETQPKDKTCATCRQPLTIRRRIEEDRTVWLWRSIFLQFITGFFTLAISAGLFTLIVKLNGLSSPVPFLPLYFGLPVDSPEHLTEFVLTLFPRWIFWGIIGFSFYSLALMVLLYVRVPQGNVLYMVSGCILLAFGVFMMIVFYSSYIGITVGAVVFILGAAQMLLSYNLWDDFLFEEGRFRLKLDRDAKTSTTCFHSGRKYIKLEMWGLAIIHLRQAVFLAPKNVSYHAMLALACLNARQYDLAERTITNMAKFAPNAPEVWQLRKELEALTEGNT